MNPTLPVAFPSTVGTIVFIIGNDGSSRPHQQTDRDALASIPSAEREAIEDAAYDTAALWAAEA